MDTTSLCALALALYASASAAPVIEKGRDISPLLRADSLAREDAALREREAARYRDDLAEAMRVDGYGTECIAFDPEADACLVTVEEFNRELEGRAFATPEAGPGSSAGSDLERRRGALLNRMLDRKFRADPPLPDVIRDSLQRAFRQANAARVAGFRQRQGDSALRALYRAQFAKRFKGKEERTYQVLASTDSLAVDSLRASRPAAWGRIPFESLDPALTASAQRLEPGRSAGPIRTAFGYAYIRFAERRVRPDVPFEEALPALILLMHPPAEDAARRNGLIAEYHRSHQEEFASPDTARLRTWLLPPVLARGPSRGNPAAEDTARVRPLVLSQTALPSAIQEAIGARSIRVGRLLGPIRSPYGTWWFRVESVARGGRPLSLEECRPEIERILFGAEKGDAGVVALGEAKAKESDLWNGMVGEYLSRGKAEAAAAGAAKGPDDRNDPLEREKREWIRKRLVFRFVEPAEGPLASGEAEK